jgi:hypothetical protein
MGIANETNNKNVKDGHKSNEDFMSERMIKDNLEKRLLKNKQDLAQRLAGKKLFIGSRERTFEDLKDEGDPLPWIEPDDEDNQHLTSHGKDKHEFTYRHMEPLDTEGEYTCNSLTDKWFEWFLRTPASMSTFTNPSELYPGTSMLGSRNAFLFQDQERFFKDDEERTKLSVYFSAAAPFQDPPDIRTITITEKAALLIPVYTMSASTQDHPRLDTDEKLKQLIVEDLSGVIQLKAWFDRVPIEGCCVIRQSRLSLANIPTDNVIGIPERRLIESRYSIETCHGGYWLLIRKEKLTAGDHLLEFMAYSKNYEIAAKLLINVLT